MKEGLKEAGGEEEEKEAEDKEERGRRTIHRVIIF